MTQAKDIFILVSVNGENRTLSYRHKHFSVQPIEEYEGPAAAETNFKDALGRAVNQMALKTLEDVENAIEEG